MAKLSGIVSALAIGAGISSTIAFAPASSLSSSCLRPITTTTPSSPVRILLSAVAEKQQQQSPLAPLTVWGEQIPNIIESQRVLRSRSDINFAPTIRSTEVGLARDDITGQLAYVTNNAYQIKRTMVNDGAVIFRDFELMKTQSGFVQFYEALGMKVCLDPLHSVSARPTVDGTKNSPVYEAVNKESRKNFFIGMHNEFVGTRAPRAAAFVCFKSAEVGGEFLIADGRQVFRDLKPDVVQRLYERNIRYSVMELPFFGWVDNLPEPVRPVAMGAIKGLASAAINAKVDFSVDLRWGEGGYDGVKMLQARAPSEPPILVHPVTGEPHWFCNVHSHSSKLRKDREAIYGAERFEDGASQINKSDMFYGDDGEISDADLEHIDEVTMKNVQFVKMEQGDVVLLDNYKCMHGRNVFDGTRKHGVAWFEGWEGEEEMKADVSSSRRKEAIAEPYFATLL
jgi:alpha-ketoglutarate-dependent taurine dioxygenase